MYMVDRVASRVPRVGGESSVSHTFQENAPLDLHVLVSAPRSSALCVCNLSVCPSARRPALLRSAIHRDHHKPHVAKAVQGKSPEGRKKHFFFCVCVCVCVCGQGWGWG